MDDDVDDYEPSCEYSKVMEMDKVGRSTCFYGEMTHCYSFATFFSLLLWIKSYKMA